MNTRIHTYTHMYILHIKLVYCFFTQLLHFIRYILKGVNDDARIRKNLTNKMSLLNAESILYNDTI